MAVKKILSGILLCALAAPALAEAIQSPTVSLQLDSKSGQLEFSVMNRSATAVVLNSYSLPWGIESFVWMNIETFSPKCKKLTQYSALEEIPLTKRVIKIMPASTIKGTINLLDRFPDLREGREGCQDVLFWSYEFVDYRGQHLGRFSGAIELNGHK